MNSSYAGLYGNTVVPLMTFYTCVGIVFFFLNSLKLNKNIRNMVQINYVFPNHLRVDC